MASGLIPRAKTLILLVCLVLINDARSVSIGTKHQSLHESFHYAQESIESEQGQESAVGFKTIRNETISKRALLQRTSQSDSEVQPVCSLIFVEVERFYDATSRQWLVNDDVLEELDGDVQAIIECANDRDTVLFRTNRIIKPTRTLIVSTNLTLSTLSEDVVGNDGPISVPGVVRFTCPDSGQLLILRSPSLTLANVVVEDCTSTRSVIELSPECDDERFSGQIRFLNVTMRRNMLTGQGHLINAGSASCLQLEMDNVSIRSNRCIGTHCIILSGNSTLTNIQLIRNQDSNDTSLDSSIISASQGSETMATNVRSEGNEIRIFQVSNGALSITDSQFINNTRNQSSVTRDNSIGGGVLFANSSSVSIANTIFERNYAVNGGGVFAWASNITITGCIFRENNAGDGNGGALYGHYNSSFDISSSVFSHNRGYLGAVLDSDYNLRVRLVNSQILENNSSEACNVRIGQGRADIRGCTFLQNNAFRGAGAMCTTNVTLSLRNTSFIQNKANLGGACAFQHNSTVGGSNLTFQNNAALTEDGGAFYFSFNGRIRLRDSLFEGNAAHRHGGAIRVGGDVEMLLNRVLFLNNTAVRNGGAVFVWTANFTGFSLTLRSNNAASTGGAIMGDDAGQLNVDSSEFTENEAEYGGAIGLDGVNISSVNNSIFRNNIARTSGSVLLERSEIHLRFVEFNTNKAQYGASLYLYEHSNATILDSEFANNTATENGGFAYLTTDSSLSLHSVVVYGHEAINGGGLSMRTGSNATIANCTFTDNRASLNGGVIRLESNCSITLLNSSFTRNKAIEGGCLYIAHSCNVTASNVRLEHNVARGSGGAIYMQQSNATLENTTIKSNEARENCGGICGLDASHIEANNLLAEDNLARNVGGGIVVANASSLLCYSCMVLDNRAFSGAGLYVFSNNSIPLVAQLQDSRFENNSAQSYGGGIELSAPQNRSIVCGEQGVICGHIVLLNTDFVSNYATYSGAVVLTTNAKALLVSCNYNESGRDFVDEEVMRSLSLVRPKNLCSTWRNNRLSTNAYGDLVGTYGQEIVLSMSTKGAARLVGNSSSEYVLENVSSGRELPNINVIILDGYGVGPAPTLPYSFEARLDSPDGFFTGVYPAIIHGGVGNFSRIGGVAAPRNYTIKITFNNPAFENINVVVVVRECQVGEESTRDELTCQACDDFSYNFNPSEFRGCKECPSDATCRGRYIVPKNGHWHKSPCHDTTQECLVEDACSYEARNETLADFTQNSTDCVFNEMTLDSYNDALCNEGYKGLLCGSCKSSFGLSVLFLCVKCTNIVVAMLIIVGITLYLLVTSAITIRGCLPANWRPQDHNPVLNELANAFAVSRRDPEVNVEMVRMMVEGHVPREYFRNKQEPSTSQTPDTSAKQESEYELTRWRTTEIFKIMLNFLQTTAAAATVSVNWTDGVLNLFRAAEYVGALTTVALSRPVDCLVSSTSAVVRAIWRMLKSVFVPGAVIGIFVSIWGYLTVKDKKDLSYFWKRSALSIIAVTYISYLGLTEMAVRAFYCVDIYDSNDPSDNSKQRHWALDTAIKCYGKDHSSIIAIGVVVLCLVTVLFPLMSAVVLFRSRERYKKRDSWVFETAGFLFRAFKESCLFWESFVMLRKAFLSLIVVFSYPLGGESQGLLASLLLLFCLYIQLSMRPYRKEFASLNQFESVSLLVSGSTFILGLFFANNRCSDSVKAFLAAIIIIGNSAFFLLLFFAFSYSIVAHLRVLLHCENNPLPDDAPWWRVIKAYIASRTKQILDFSQNIQTT